MASPHKLPLDYLDHIPDRIYQRLVTHRYRMRGSRLHSLELRCVGIILIREKLLAGYRILIDDLVIWLEDIHAQQLHEALSNRQLISDCIDNEEYVDETILRLLDWLDHNQQKITRNNPQQPYNEQDASSADTGKTPGSSSETASAISPSSSHDKQVEAYSNEALADPELDNNKQHELLEAMQGIHQSYAIERHLGWDLTRGIDGITSVKQLLKVHKQVESLPALQAIIELIGRDRKLKVSLDNVKGINPLEIASQKAGYSLPDDHSVNSVSGVFYSDDISRMLASESAFLGHKKLKSLWHARRAEHQLLSYHIRGVFSDHTPQLDDASITPDNTSKQRLKRQGAMVVCIDTSASMQGKPELMAKAVVYQIMRVAHLQGRNCYLYAFSGEGEIAEYDLNLKSAGWQPVIDFISHSFHGGTDIDGVLHCAFEKLQQSNWRTADLLLVSDGRFKIRDIQAVKWFTAHQPSTHIYGLQVGPWKTEAFGDICHQVFNLNNV